MILIAALMEVGGLSAANRTVADLEPSLLSIWGRDLGYQGQFGMALGAVLIFSIGYMGWPHVVTRHMAMRRPATARLAGAYATGWNLLFVPAPYLLGDLGNRHRSRADRSGDGDLPGRPEAPPSRGHGGHHGRHHGRHHVDSDSLLLQTGSIAARDLYERFRAPDGLGVSPAGAGGRGSRLLRRPHPTSDGLRDRGLRHLRAGERLLARLCLRSMVAASQHPWAFVSMVAGAGVAVLWQLAGLDAASGLHAMLAGLLTSTASMIVVSLATQRIAPTPARVIELMNEAAS